MLLAAATQAVAQTVGIILLSTSLSPDNHLQALIPRIQHDANVEDHTPFIAFNSCDLIGSSGWTIARFGPVDGMLYVKLDGDRVKVTTAYEPATVQRQTNQRPADDFGQPQHLEIGLPSLTAKSCCGVRAQLRADYTPPRPLNAELDATSRLAALIDFPGAQSADACAGNTAENPRVDTLITLPPGDTVVISARQKTLRLKGGAHVYIVDFPSSFLAGTESHTHTENHYLVYFGMLDYASCNKDWRMCAGAKGPDCHTPFKRPGGKVVTTVPDDGFSHWAARVDINCSDSQYP